MEGEKRLRRDPTARSQRSSRRRRKRGGSLIWGREEATPLGSPRSRVGGDMTLFARGLTGTRTMALSDLSMCFWHCVACKRTGDPREGFFKWGLCRGVTSPHLQMRPIYVMAGGVKLVRSGAWLWPDEAVPDSTPRNQTPNLRAWEWPDGRGAEQRHPRPERLGRQDRRRVLDQGTR